MAGRRSGREGDITFNIGTRNAGVINNVAGDQRIEGGQYGTAVTAGQARRSVRDLRDGLAGQGTQAAPGRETPVRSG